jgi:hypothetical protein
METIPQGLKPRYLLLFDVRAEARTLQDVSSTAVLGRFLGRGKAKAITTADLYGMTNKRTSNCNSKMRGFFPFDRLRVRMTRVAFSNDKGRF